ncbi:glycoside hydrolase family 15 protein [Phycomyces blakesleeanus]|uniref:glucan 1,4-alpha-glucosidase n=2 Tax=Phycomyces blakesleeanus TaxID=4837 RepID=A0A167JM63_PHYB8|nr:glycoside hydrolase family 15 protein [Phycomyces blakesleeanus NRRL 1555(-)]OAD66288.1 glycoside hydrolase family 15 protein [Phycomyces blakesleeanus NRRL 1555(-)]|eukprot:XP_018284328.1 glycoside hydrolase family 15 protein [Phycomyces blakesleeanus NRRL 1555(-)]
MRLTNLWKPVLLLASLVGLTYAAVPASEVKLESYTYSNNVLSGKIYVKNIAYAKTVTVIYSDNSDSWSYSTEAAYTEPISGTNYEYWQFSTTVGSSGIHQFYIKYVVNGVSYYDNNGGQGKNYVVATSTSSPSSTSTGPDPTTPTGPVIVPTGTVAVPGGNSTISTWAKTQKATSFKMVLSNINPAGTVKGFIAASLSTSGPDYFYSWTRDSALVANMVSFMYSTEYAGDATVLGLLKDYVTFQVNEQSASTVCNCLGEPKFNKDGSSYTGSWGRPQNDGPAERASTLIAFAKTYAAQTSDSTYVSGTLKTAIFKDLDYIVTVWSNNCYDLWEEVNGLHFYTLMVMRHGLVKGAEFATANGDSTRATTYTNTANTIRAKIDTFWSSSKNYVSVTQNQSGGANKPSGLDVSVLIAANAAGLGDGFYTSGSDKILASAVAIENSFASIYSVNSNLPSWLGNAIGRYPEDTYNGNGNSQGNPWFIGIATYAELYYRAIIEWTIGSGISVNSVNLPFFQKFDSSITSGTTYAPGSAGFTTLTSKIALAADAYLSTVKYHGSTNGSFSEQFDRTSGTMTGARDLTWSHAAVITAIEAKSGLLV